MATGKQGFVGAAVPQHLVSAQREGEMHIQAPLAAMYIQAVPGLPAAVQDATVIPLPVPMMCANATVPFLTLHVSSGAAVPPQRPDAPAASPRPKAAGKHVCPHCGRDCLKPSVLEKHLRCHTGERPYPCTTCGISFKTQSNLYKHKRTQAHARLSSESGKGTFSSQESTESSREICSSPSLELPGEDPVDVFGTNSGVPTPTTATFNCAQVSTADGRAAAETERALCGAALVGISTSTGHGTQETSNPVGQQVQLSSEDINEASSAQTESRSRPPTTPNRTPLQRQEALFPKLSRGKTQSHGSTDSGFSEGSETNFTSSPGSTIHDPSMESLAESSMELQETGSSRIPLDEAHGDDKGKVSIQKKQTLEEHILKLISDNSVLVDDKDLVNVRPRKTVLSKQGSIDLPMPYTYKDSFHFEMRSSKHQLSSSPKQDRRDGAIYSSMPMQYSTSLDHAPLTRSSSLPFSMGIQTSEKTRSPHQGGNVPLSRRCSAGSICTFKSVDQQSPAHRLLVRQAAVDCASGVEVPPMERGSHSSLSSDGDCTDQTSDSSARRCRRKKAQKFAYNKWYMYGGGTFKKLYDMESSNLQKGKAMPHSKEPAESQGTQTSQHRESNSTVSSCSAACLPPAVDVLPAQTSSQGISSYVLLQSQPIHQPAQTMQPGQARPNTASSSDVTNGTRSVQGIEEQSKRPERQLSSLIPSERKKQKTEDNCSVGTEKTGTLRRQPCTLTSGIRQSNLSESVNQSLQSVCGEVFPRLGATVLQNDKLNLHRQGSLNSLPPLNQRQHLIKRHSSPLFVARESGTSGRPSAASLDSSAPHAKPSFMPMYQLKIPCITDGVSDSHLRNPPSPNQHSSRPQPPQFGPQETSPPPPPQSQSATPVPPPGQEHRGTVTKMSGTSVACKGQDANMLGKAQIPHPPSGYTSIISATPTLVSSAPQTKAANVLVQNQSAPYTTSVGPVSSILSQPLKTFTPMGQNQSVTVSTTHSTVSMLSHSSTPTKTSQIYAVTMTTEVRTSPAASVVISKKPLDTHVSVCQSATDSSPLGITQSELQGIGQAELQGSQFEDKMLLVNDSLQSLAQDTFYVRTADLQIVMQLISDEQLALIEPQIETQDFKLYGSHYLPHQNSETSQPVTMHASVSQEVHKQFSDHAIRKPCVSEADTNSSTVSNVLDTTPPSAAATEQNNSGESAKDTHCRHPENTYLTKTGPKGVLSKSRSKTVRYAPALRDSRTKTLGQLYKSHKVGVAAKELESAGHGTAIRSYPKQSPAGTLGEVSVADRPTANSGSGSQPCASPASRNLSVSTVRVGEHGCVRSTDDPGDVRTPEAALSRPAGSTQRTPMSLKEKGPLWPDGPVLSDTCQQEDCQPVLTTAGQHKSCQLLAGTCKSVEGETAEIVAEEATVPPGSISLLQKELLSAVQPSQLKPCRLACPTPATDRKNCSRSASDPTLCQHQPLNQSGVHGGDESKVQENESCGPGQASGHLPQQDSCSQRPDITCEQKEVTDAQFSPHRPASKAAQEERAVCGAPSGGMGHAGHDPCTGPWLGGSLQSSQLHWEAGTEFQGWAPQESKNREEDNKREGTTGTTEGTQTAVNLHLHLSQPVTNVCPNTHYYATALCGVTSLSHGVPALCQRDGVSHINSEQVQVSSSVGDKAVQDLISPGVVKACDRVSSGSHKRFTSLPTGHLHLANEQSSSENAILKEDQKETHVKNSATQSHSRSSHLSQHKRDGAAESRESTEPCATLSPCTAAASGAPNATSANPDAPYPNLTNSYAIHYKQICVSTTHSNSTEPASQCHAGGSYLEEERTSSSSDDEGKLVIELE